MAERAETALKDLGATASCADRPPLREPASAWTAIAPMLCRVPAYCGPGLPSPTTNHGVSDKPGSGRLVSRVSSGGSRISSLLASSFTGLDHSGLGVLKRVLVGNGLLERGGRSGLRVLAGGDGGLDRLDGGG